MEIQKINGNPLFIILLGVSGSLFLALSVIFFYVKYHRRFLLQKAAIQKAELTHRQYIVNAIIQSQENERMRISKDLHDHIGSSLSSLRFMVSRIQKTVPGAQGLHQITEEYKSNIDRIIEDVRNISHSLSPAGLALFGFQDTLEEFCEKMSKSTGVEIHLKDNTGGILQQMNFDVALSLFRIMQELTSNTIKHAAASMVSITTTTENEFIAIRYADNGKGTDVNIFNQRGIGMYNIESRLTMMNARFEAKSSAGAGFVFNIWLPQTTLDQTSLYE